eukprot:CAMPEP_0172414362 /NCGR_PEP_ID=MMETSP1064-20121228/1027_1 /TAXON_ID=202472 /ORGANISM="Aulacoseira subarctica , Strain CCAP 1002/5" /LENGTH=71 /DNA_ID=CAMNT_0013150995 /DNA_START=112 /DNA_END=327 /DNA_ORIENTATION=+
MALRRPPTRIELKAEDIEEYEKIRVERLQAEESIRKAAGGHIETSEELATKMMARKRTAAERIGLRKDSKP